MTHCCNVCERERTDLEGFYLLNVFICLECEQEIVQTSPESPIYNYFVEKLRMNKQPKQYS